MPESIVNEVGDGGEIVGGWKAQKPDDVLNMVLTIVNLLASLLPPINGCFASLAAACRREIVSDIAGGMAREDPTPGRISLAGVLIAIIFDYYLSL